jgi:hypothetical protein
MNHSIFFMMQAGRDLKFISLSMSGCFSLGALLLLVERSISWFTEDPFFFLKKKSLRFSFYVLTLLSSSSYQLVKGFGLTGCWAALVGFQWVRLN